MTIISTEHIDESELEQYEVADFNPGEPKRSMYVDNDKLTEAMLDWSTAIQAAKESGAERPRMPEFIGLQVWLIAENMAKKSNFSGYSWIDEMKEDGIEACCAYLHNWKHDAATRKGKPNPYGYISKIIEQAFKHRIEVENRQNYYKNKSLLLMGGPEAFEGEDWGDNAEATNNMLQDMVNRAYEYEEKQSTRLAAEREKQDKKKPKQQTLMDMFAVTEEGEQE
jgi:hypothetical protein